jgi:hypothetical protein
MATIVALRLCGPLARLKLIDLFVKVDLCADVRVGAQTTQPMSRPFQPLPRPARVKSRPLHR